MRRRSQNISKGGKLTAWKLDPGVFVVEVPETGRCISLGQPPDVIKRLQQVGYAGDQGVNTFVLVDSKLQGDSISWSLVEFPILYALYFVTVDHNGKRVPAFHAGVKPLLVGLPDDVRKAMAMIKYGNYGMDDLDELDGLDLPAPTRDALKKEILGLAVGNVIKASEDFIQGVPLEPLANQEKDFSDIGDGIKVGRVGWNTYRFLYGGDEITVDVTLAPGEQFRAPVEYKHLKFPVTNFGVWHTGEYDGMDPYYSCAHTTLIHHYAPVPVDYPSNMTDVLAHNGLSKDSVDTIVVTHNHDDHIGAMVELFRRSHPCHIVTTAPVQYSVVRKLSVLVDLPEDQVRNSFSWTLLPFRADKPFQTEEYNMGGLRVTGHLSCHSVPTTVYTFQINHAGHTFQYGHFLDIVAFKRMATLVKDGWMPKAHMAHLEQVIRKTPYDLIKYDAGCTSDAALPFTVHGQWQDLAGSATPAGRRVFTHANRAQLDPAYQSEGRFVSVGDLDSSMESDQSNTVWLGGEKTATTSFYSTAYRMVRAYFLSIMDTTPTQEQWLLIEHYSAAFATCPKQPDANIGGHLMQQGSESNAVLVIVRGLAEIVAHDAKGAVVFRSKVGDGEVVGDVGVLTGAKRMASIRSLNRLSFLSVPASLFREAAEALGITYAGTFKEKFDRRMRFQQATDISRDVSTLVLNRIAGASHINRVQKGAMLYEEGQKDGQLYIVPGNVTLTTSKGETLVKGPTVVGEAEFFLRKGGKAASRQHGARAESAMEVLVVDAALLEVVPVVVDNLRRLIRHRQHSHYPSLHGINPTAA